MIHGFLIALNSWYDPDTYLELSPWALSLSLGLLTYLFEDIALVIGVAVIHQKASLMMPLFWGLLVGIVSGDVILYVVGRWFKNIAHIERWMMREGASQIINVCTRNIDYFLVISRAIPASRLPTLLAAGFLKVKFYKFISIVLTSGVIWVSAILILGINIVTYFNAKSGFSAAWLLPFVIAVLILKNIVKQQKTFS